MKILELDLHAFGPFTRTRLNLAQGREGLHILYGPNEAGKSSALRALKCLLYGIPKHSADNFLHDHRSLRIGGRLRNADGGEFAFLRRKGNKETILTPAGEPIDERWLDPYLHGVTGEAFGFLFGIDHDALVRGGRTLLAGKGETGQSLFAAGAGGADLRAVLETIEAEAEALFKSRGQLPVINKAISRHQELRKTIAELSQSSREWAEKEKELTKAMGERARLKKSFEQQAAELNRLQRLKEIVPRAGLRKELSATLAAMGAVTILPEEFTGRRHRAEKRLNAALEVKRQAELDLERLTADIAEIVWPQRLLDQADAVEGIHKRLGQHIKAVEDLGRLQGRLQQNKADIQALLQEVKPGLAVEAVRALRPQAAAKTRIQTLASRHASLQSDQLRAARGLREAERKLDRLKEELNALDAPRESGPLKKTLAGLAKSGDLAAALREARQALENEAGAVRGLLQRLPLWSQTAAEPGTLPVPSPETVSRFEDEFSGGKVVADNLDRRLGEAREALRAVAQQIGAIRLAGAVPTEEELGRDRERRQKGWALVRRAWLKAEDVVVEAGAFDPQRELAEAYEASVARADATADRLRREAARVAEYAALLAQEEKNTEEIEKLQSERCQADHRLAETGARWQAAWRPAGIEPLTPREMRSWLEHYDRILQRLDRVEGQKGVIARIEGQIAEHRAELLQRLAALGERAPAADETFGRLCERCETLLERLERLARRRRELEEKLTALGEERKECVQSQDDEKERMRVWEAEWAQAVDTLLPGEGPTPDEALVVLAKLDELFRKIDACDGMEQRIFGINRDAEVFQADVKALVAHVAPAWAALMPDQAAVQLNAELTRARSAAARHAQLAKEIEQKHRGLGDAEKEIALARDILGGLCRQAECAAPDALEAREKVSADYQEVRRRIRSLDADIVERGGGEALNRILEQVEQVDIDAVAAQIEEMEARHTELRDSQAESNERVGRLRNDLEHIDGSSAAAEAAEESQGVLAAIRDGVEEYVKLRLAALVLRRAIESYRVKNQGPLLERAGVLFARLTLGSFAGLKTDYGESDEPILQGVRPGGRAVDVSGMSDGTLDQLFLSLRLASLEQYLDANEPMPFIVDDILIRFDDDRARATLDVLADLSKRTQVLFFTHHRHLPELARKRIDSDRLVIHELGA